MSTALRPMSTGEVLDRTFYLYRNHFLLFAGISIVQVLCMLVGILLVYAVVNVQPGAIDSQNPGIVMLGVIAYLLVIGLFFLIGYALSTGATIYAVSKLHLGHTAGIRDSYREMSPLLGRTVRIVLTLFVRVLGVMFLTEFVIFVVTALVNALDLGFRRGQSVAGEWMIAILMVGIFTSGMIWAARVGCRYSLAVPACLLEKLPARQALKRSNWLTRGFLWRIFMVFLLMIVLGLGLYYALEIPAFLLAEAYPGAIGNILVWSGASVAMILAFPIGTIAICLMYYDQRVRKEAFDLQLMMEALGQQQPSPQPAPAPIA